MALINCELTRSMTAVCHWDVGVMTELSKDHSGNKCLSVSLRLSLDINPKQYLMPGHSQTKCRQISSSHNYYKYSFFPRTIAQGIRLPSNVFAHNSLDAFKGALQDINLKTAPFRHLQINKQYTTPPLSPFTHRPYHTPTLPHHWLVLFPISHIPKHKYSYSTSR